MSLQSTGRVLGMLALLAGPMAAQSGGGSSCCQSVTSRVQGGTMTLHEGQGRDRREWLQAVVLWRASDRIGDGYSSDVAPLIERARRTAQFASAEAGRQFLGGFYSNGFHYADYSADRRRLWVLGREYALPERDSALVVMVDRVDGVGGPVVIAGYAYMTAQLPERYWLKSWMSGDTTFMVHPRDQQHLLLEALRGVTAVRAFIEGPPSR